MLQSLRNIWDIPDLRKRVLFTLGLLAVYRLGSHVPTPGINARALIDFFEQNRANWFGLVDMFSGGNLAKVTVFALGIMPYISASIILQLLTVVWPYLEKLSKEGELGRRKITQYTRYGTVLLSIVQSLGIAVYLERMTLSQSFRIVENPGIGFKLMTVLTLTTGTAFIMWLGEQITERGIGNGMSLIIFAGIVVGFPRGMFDTVDEDPAQRAEPAHRPHPRRPDGVRGGGHRVRGARAAAHHRAIRQARGGAADVRRPVHPPAPAREHQRRHPRDLRLLDHRLPADHRVLLPGQQPLDADRLRAAAPGACRSTTCSTSRSSSSSATSTPRSSSTPTTWRRTCASTAASSPASAPASAPRSTSTTSSGRITFGGAIYLAVIALLPEFLITGFKVAPIPGIGPGLDQFLTENNLGWITEGLGLNFYFGGTSLLIIVGVAMDTVAQVEAQLVMRHYDGFSGPGKGRRIRGRR